VKTPTALAAVPGFRLGLRVFRRAFDKHDTPSLDPSRKSIKVWRDDLDPGKRAKLNLNHPKAVWCAYWAETEPRAERDAKRVERAERR
jgi:hypothetical protein